MKFQLKNTWSVSRKLSFISVFSLFWLGVQAQQPIITVQMTDTANTTHIDVQVVTDTLVSTLRQAQGIAPLNDRTLSKVEVCRHEFSIWTSGGASFLHYKPSFGSRKIKAGGAFGMGYTYYFHPNWGIRTGLEAAVYNTTFRFGKLRDVYIRQGFDDWKDDGMDWTGDFHTEVSNYTERQRLYNLNFPLMLQFQTSLAGGLHQFFASAGAKLGIPIQNTYRVSGATLYTWFYHHRLQQEFRPDPTGLGTVDLEALGCFYNIPYSTGRKTNNFSVAGSATVEAGVKFFLNPKFSLYVGGHIDHGFNNISKNRGNHFFEFDPENIEIISNSVLTAQHAHSGIPVTNFISKVSPLFFGLTVRLGINMCPTPRRERATRPAVAPPINININNCNHCCRCCEPCEKQDSVLRKLTELVLTTIPSRRACTSQELAEYDRATKEYGPLEDLLILRLDGYYTDQTSLTPRMKAQLDAKIAQLQKYNSPEFEIICEGHTCDLGSASYNMTLGRMRAEVVRNYLITRGGFHPNNVRVVSKGLTAPIVENSDEAHRKINRRVVFLIKRK